MANILVVDDDLLIRDVIGRLLEQAGHKVWRVSNTSDARGVLGGVGRIDAAVIDLALRDAPGLDLIRHMHAAYPSLPVVVISGYIGPDSTDLRATLASLGVEHALAKPIDKQTLLDAVSGVTAH